MENATPDFAAVAQLGADVDSVEVDCPELDDRAIADAIRAYKDAEALKDALVELAMPIIRKAYVDKCRERGKVLSSVNCRGIQFVFQNRYTPLSAADTIKSAKARVGEDRFVQMFAPAYSYEVPISKVDAELFALLCARGIKPKMVLKPTKAYHEATILEDGFGDVTPEREAELKASGVSLKPLPKNVAYIQRKPEVVEGKEVHYHGTLPTVLPQVIREVAPAVQGAPVPVQQIQAAAVKSGPTTVELKKVKKELRLAMRAIAGS